MPANDETRPKDEITVPVTSTGPYDIASSGHSEDAPPLPGEVEVAPEDELIDRVTADLYVHAQNCVSEFGDFHLAVSGNQRLLPLYERLMYDPNVRGFPWRRTHLWMTDDRCVDSASTASTFLTIRETIGDHADIPEQQIHPLHADRKTADREYGELLRDTLGWRERGHDRLDCVLLDLAPDGHIASIFAQEEPDTSKRWMAFTESPHGTDRERLTMTLTLLNTARLVAVWAADLCVESALIQLGQSPSGMPAAGLDPSGVLKWYLTPEYGA